MIVLDIETSGLNPSKNGIVSVGAICLENPKLKFYGECKLDIEDEIDEGAIKVNGFNEENMRDESKQTQKQLVERFFKWVDKRKMKNFLCQNPQFDVAFLRIKAQKYNLEASFHYRAFDLHSIAQKIYFDLNKKFLVENKENYSGMDLTNVLKLCGIKDTRIKVERGGEIIKKGTTHNALEDAKLAAECFSRLMFGKNLFPEFTKYPIPEVLKK